MWNRLVGVGWVDADAIFTELGPFGADAETLPNTIKLLHECAASA
jgi:hypothetical protein